MRTKGKMIGWTLGLAAVAALITTGTVYAASSDQPAAKPKKVNLSMDDMRQVLVPLGEQPQSRFVRGPVTLKQAAKDHAFEAPPNMAFEPKVCATYLADVFGGLDSLNGWLQYGSRLHQDHNDNFIQVAVNIPKGIDLNKIKEAVMGCRKGTLTISDPLGTSAQKAVGDITYTEREAPALPGAQTLAITGQTVFHAKPGTAEGELVRKFEMPPDAQLLVNSKEACVENTTFTEAGNTLLVVMDADPQLANSLTQSMYSKVAQALKS